MTVSAYASAFCPLVWMRLHMETFKNILARPRGLSFHFQASLILIDADAAEISA